MEAWGHREVTELLQTVIDSLPAGSVLILEVGDNLPFISRTMDGAPEEGDRVTELLLDGQQRLTALWRAFNNNYRDRTYFVEILDDSAGPSKPQVTSVSRWERIDTPGKRYPIWADSPKECWRRRFIPVHLLRPGEEAEVEVDEWVEQALNGDAQQERALHRSVSKLRQKVASFNLPFLSLPIDTPREVVLDVFVKMNTQSVRLTAYDIIVAQTEEATGQSLHDLVRGLASTAPNLSEYDTPQDIILNVMSLLQDRVPNQTGYFGLDFRRMVDEWPLLVRGAQHAVDFLTQESVLDAARLPTESILAPLIALWSYVPERPDAQGNARILLRKYIWRSFFTNRYERAAATATLQDFRALRDVLNGSGDEQAVPCFNEEKHPLPQADELAQAGWPKYRDRLARAILLLSLRGGAHDIADDSSATRDQLKRREYHHLYPVGYLKSLGFDEGTAYRALNCALISWRTNRTISAKEPLKYLVERAEASTLGEAAIRQRLATHAISYDGLAMCDYEAFVQARADAIHRAMRRLCAGESWLPNSSD
jgi:hypothetical protein